MIHRTQEGKNPGQEVLFFTTHIIVKKTKKLKEKLAPVRIVHLNS
jgi:hypothetical protein